MRWMPKSQKIRRPGSRRSLGCPDAGVRGRALLRAGPHRDGAVAHGAERAGAAMTCSTFKSFDGTRIAIHTDGRGAAGDPAPRPVLQRSHELDQVGSRTSGLRRRGFARSCSISACTGKARRRRSPDAYPKRRAGARRGWHWPNISGWCRGVSTSSVFRWAREPRSMRCADGDVEPRTSDRYAAWASKASPNGRGGRPTSTG